jgi:hypothetical protein
MLAQVAQSLQGRTMSYAVEVQFPEKAWYVPSQCLQITFIGMDIYLLYVLYYIYNGYIV